MDRFLKHFIGKFPCRPLWAIMYLIGFIEAGRTIPFYCYTRWTLWLEYYDYRAKLSICIFTIRYCQYTSSIYIDLSLLPRLKHMDMYIFSNNTITKTNWILSALKRLIFWWYCNLEKRCRSNVVSKCIVYFRFV